jgi:hypothetical protein
VANKYADLLERQIIRHRLIKRTGEAHRKSKSKRGLQRRLNRLDKELGQYMRYAERRCRRIKSGRIPFSPKAALWIRQTQVYRSLLKFHSGRISNKGNLKRAARCDIAAPLSLSICAIYLRLKTCAAQCNYYRKHGDYYRWKHLYSQLNEAKEKEDEEAAWQILAIIQREKERRYWRRMNYALGKPRGGACFKVQVEGVDGTVTKYTGNDKLENVIRDNIHRKRFILAEDAPLCSGKLHGEFGYNAIFLVAALILAGTYEYPDDFDEATKEILQECARIRMTIPKDSVNTTITRDDWEAHWRRTKEGTSS